MNHSIHPTAIIHEGARLGENVLVGPFTIIHENVLIGDNSKIGSHCELGVPTSLAADPNLIIGDNAEIRSHSVFYQGSVFGPQLTTGHRVTVREGTRSGLNLQIGTLCDIQGDCTIGDYVRFHSNVHVGKKSKIGNFVWIFPYVVLTNDPTPPSDFLVGCEIEDYAVVATMSVVLPGVKVGKHSLVAAHACVGKDVPAQKVVAGVPARVVADTKDILRRDGSGEPAYPWPQHFHRGYPEGGVVDMWKQGKFGLD